MDNYNRPSKRGGAWMSSFRKQSVRDGEFIHPVITINCNFSRPAGDSPSLLTFDEYTTFFHEFGHALHGLMSDCKYHSLSGTSVPRDFVELPSQVMENWARHPEVMRMFARHYQTGEIIPQELIDKIMEAGHFNQGFETVEYLATAIIDMDYHTLEERRFHPVEFEDRVDGEDRAYTRDCPPMEKHLPESYFQRRIFCRILQLHMVRCA
jgi:peptidyl-dipeptidase Dcp